MRALQPHGLKGDRFGVVPQDAGVSIPVDKLFADAVDVMRKAGAEIIDPVEVAGIDKTGDPELIVLKYEFKDGLNSYFTWLGPNSPVKSLADVIEFNNKNASKEMPFFG